VLFNSFQFLVFFPVVTLLYFLLPHRYRWLHLLAASCVFYAAFIPVYILILGFTIVVDYFAGILIDKAQGRRRKLFLACSIVANVLVLAVFKYYNFFTANINELFASMNVQTYELPFLSIILPIGLSFHTFQAMSYTIEVYRGKYPPERHFGYYSLYVMFYPQLVAGPIERPQNVLPQLHAYHPYDHQKMVSGLRLMLWGLFKKVVIADRLAIIVNEVYGNVGNYSGIEYAIATVFFGVQIYCDFSGYSDIAIGSARTMGIDLMVNFRRPYFAATISEFWRRWHISLSTWFRDYVYIPLGGSRVSEGRRNVNLFLVFMVSGLWHGASWNFVIWGALHGCFLVAANFIHKVAPTFAKRNLLNILLTFFLVNIAWIFFRATTFSDAMDITQSIFGIGGDSYFTLARRDLAGNATYLGMALWKFISVILLVSLLFIADQLLEKGWLPSWYRKPTVIKWATYYALILIILTLGVFDMNQFIYFQF
jgi:D-alanyl-lipoteichoic acid acyltransferase DltB (MBOAT superfamily)